LIFQQETNSCRKRIAPESSVIKSVPCHGELRGWQAAEKPCAFTGRRVDIRHDCYAMLPGHQPAGTDEDFDR
jgi:hypothetical protein